MQNNINNNQKSETFIMYTSSPFYKSTQQFKAQNTLHSTLNLSKKDLLNSIKALKEVT